MKRETSIIMQKTNSPRRRMRKRSQKKKMDALTRYELSKTNKKFYELVGFLHVQSKVCTIECESDVTTSGLPAISLPPPTLVALSLTKHHLQMESCAVQSEGHKLDASYIIVEELRFNVLGSQRFHASPQFAIVT